jgi:hypothetical protein
MRIGSTEVLDTYDRCGDFGGKLGKHPVRPCELFA